MTTDDAIIPTELRHSPWAAFARNGHYEPRRARAAEAGYPHSRGHSCVHDDARTCCDSRRRPIALHSCCERRSAVLSANPALLKWPQ